MQSVILVLVLAGGLAQTPAAKTQEAPSCRAGFDRKVAMETAWPSLSQCAPGTVLPKVIKESKPRYSKAAMEQRVQGVVEMEVVVDRAGRVASARTVRALHPELDAEAIETVKQWRFEPARTADKTVAVLVNIEMTFALR
jgi:TonB family protein